MPLKYTSLLTNQKLKNIILIIASGPRTKRLFQYAEVSLSEYFVRYIAGLYQLCTKVLIIKKSKFNSCIKNGSLAALERERNLCLAAGFLRLIIMKKFLCCLHVMST